MSSPKKTDIAKDVVTHYQKNTNQKTWEENDRTIAEKDRSSLHQSTVDNNTSENNNLTVYDSTADSSDAAPNLLLKKKKKLTKLRGKDDDFSDSSSSSEIDELKPKQSCSRHRRKKISKKFDDNHSEDSINTPPTLQEIKKSFDTTEEYIENLLSYLKYNIKYVTNEKLKKELNDKMLSLEMEHKKKQNGLEGC